MVPSQFLLPGLWPSSSTFQGPRRALFSLPFREPVAQLVWLFFAWSEIRRLPLSFSFRTSYTHQQLLYIAFRGGCATFPQLYTLLGPFLLAAWVLCHIPMASLVHVFLPVKILSSKYFSYTIYGVMIASNVLVGPAAGSQVPLRGSWQWVLLILVSLCNCWAMYILVFISDMCPCHSCIQCIYGRA